MTSPRSDRPRPRSEGIDRRRAWAILSAGGIAALASVTGMALTTGADRSWLRSGLVCADQRTGEILGRWDGGPGTEVSLRWLHSIELTPWTDVFTVEDSGFRLVRTEFSALGAGTPEGRPATTTTNDGLVVMDDLDQHLDTINWIHSHTQRFTLTINGALAAAPDDLPHHRPLELRSS